MLFIVRLPEAISGRWPTQAEVSARFALARVPDALSLEEAGPLMCADITTFNALRHSGAQPGDTVAIHGVGGLGHLAIRFADKMGFRTIAINRGKSKEALARKLGTDAYIDSDDGSADEALARLGGATVALSTVGSSAAQVDLSLGLKPNGRLVFVATDHQPLGISPDLPMVGRMPIRAIGTGGRG